MLQRSFARVVHRCLAAALVIGAAGVCAVSAARGTGLGQAHATAGRITSVTFRGTPKRPSVLIRGRNLGRKPAPYPRRSPSEHLLCGAVIKGNAGLDYGTSLYLVDVDGKWAAGRYRPRLLELDCIGLIVTRFTQTEVAYRFGGGYAQVYSKYSLAQGDVVNVVVNGASATVRVRYGATVTT